MTDISSMRLLADTELTRAGIPYEGNYSGWLEQKQKRLEQEGRAEDARVKSLSRELEWVRSAPKARQAKSKARINAYEKLLADDQQRQMDVAKIHIPAGPRLGDVVINAEGLGKGFGDRLLIDDLSFRLPPGGIVGVIGPNGAGKTTLFRMITGADAPDSGSFTIGDTVKLGYVDQSRDDLEEGKTVWEVISDGLDEIELGKRTMASRAYVGQFNFKEVISRSRSASSGGERNRVHLAKMLKSGANLLLLDEPTNDLDVDTLRALEEALEEFAGCAVVVSHDRWFLDRIATHILAFEGNSHVEWFEGNYEAYEADKKRRLGAEADRSDADQIQAHQPLAVSRCAGSSALTGLAGAVLAGQLLAHRLDKCAKLALVLADDGNVFLFLRDQHRNILDFDVENLAGLPGRVVTRQFTNTEGRSPTASLKRPVTRTSLLPFSVLVTWLYSSPLSWSKLRRTVPMITSRITSSYSCFSVALAARQYWPAENRVMPGKSK